MRQRYLLGRYNRQRYVDQYKFLSEQYNPNEFFIVSTDQNRTIQSGYSELMGLYPPESAERLTIGMVTNLRAGIGLPPFKVRDVDEINTDLGLWPVSNGFAAVDVKIFGDQDGVDSTSCKWI